ncbi:response regulator transcription factor [Parvicella tangerina]|uniref:HTH luxR-type domain-containing protein n=1 Tax=Parvicella tangerina TaxID=2829795 RepID=A0A916NEX4_9FLAO|nr:hypothetical protein CRYO30217_00063 [Parvicella tangerina]
MNLTKREKTVSDMMLKGKSNAEISNELCISVNTVKTHVARVLKKENVKNRIQLITKQVNKNSK